MITTVWTPDFTSGISPVGVERFVRELEKSGAAGTGLSTTADNYRNVAGLPKEYGVQAHDDFQFANSRFTVSHAVYRQERGL